MESESITCSEDKGTGESNESIDWVEWAMKEKPEIFKVREDIKEAHG